MTTGLNTLICKGAVEEVMSLCTRVEVKGEVIEVLPEHDAKRRQLADELNGQGFRVIALAYKQMPGASDEPVYSVKDESDLILLGFLAFLDPPKDTATEALKRLHSLNVDVKVLTGDNEIITAYICKEVGMPVEHLLLGSQIEAMSETELAEAASATSVFARLAPAHKERIIRALQSKGHVLGFMGDGINDAPALKAADVGISVDSAVDIAKESSDIILLENSLLVLEQGVLEGRRVFGNIVKYIKMAASSNFGNMFSVVGASAFLPFLPMLPIQVLTNNLLYDFSQTTIPTDEVDADWLTKPRQWTIGKILRFILFIGPISSIFDYLTFFMMLYVFNCWHNPALFHTGWFVESLFTQTLIIHVIRTNKIPFIQSRASWPLILTSVIIVAVGAWLTVSPLANTLGFVPLPPLYWLYLADHAAGLCDPDPGGEDLVYSQVWRMMAMKRHSLTKKSLPLRRFECGLASSDRGGSCQGRWIKLTTAAKPKRSETGRCEFNEILSQIHKGAVLKLGETAEFTRCQEDLLTTTVSAFLITSKRKRDLRD